ncbi:hypothetical protein EJ02DRAFT_355506 [Clathrospora elynae]|uniref:NAD(P)-binding protein n=1 Tax=Clathrospora elynae TaxID=706981 RepID=A0A6A5SKY3_9PLEO|nr:hypothetical protein EJ02DRAFT_355506 [Clathrospora elynae]
MPSVQTARDAIAALPKGPPLVVALVGGTTGIGSYVAKTLAATFANEGPRLRVYIVGRRADRAENIVSYGREKSPGSDWRFVQASDGSLMSDVDRVSREITRQEEEAPFAGGPPRLDVLYLSQALSPDTIKPGELPIGTPQPASYGITAVRNHSTFMKTFFFEELAEKHAGKISFTHIHPGLVDGPTFYSDVNPRWFVMLWRVVKPLVSWYMTSPEVLAFSSQHELGGGAYAVGQRGDERKDKVWDHTTETLAEIERCNAA